MQGTFEANARVLDGDFNVCGRSSGFGVDQSDLNTCLLSVGRSREGKRDCNNGASGK